ncbi:MAG: hypothetical protein HRU43_02250 [Simkaniaceae bacterium]|nr:hypothetical protein [Simkaniaceae bacterium]
MEYLLSFQQLFQQAQPQPIKEAPSLDEEDFEIVEWNTQNNVSYELESFIDSNKVELEKALAFIPFFQNKENITAENISLVIDSWNTENPKDLIDTKEDLFTMIQSLKIRCIKSGERTFLNAGGLYILYSKSASNVAAQVIGKIPKDNNYEQTMLNWHFWKYN